MTTTRTSKVCSVCDVRKDIDEFSINESGRLGRDACCTACKIARDTTVRDRRLKRYGLTAEAYETMLAGQNGVCACCGGPPGARSLHVDHDHTTGEIRGLLCHHCNIGLGYFKDDEDRLMAAVAYLIRSRRRY